MTEKEINHIKIKKALNDLIGKKILYNTREYSIKDWRSKEGIIIIVAEPEWIELIETTAFGKIKKEFLPIEDDKTYDLSLLPSNGASKQLKEILLENIKSVTKDPEYVNQANAINKSAQALINLVRLELEMVKLKSKID